MTNTYLEALLQTAADLDSVGKTLSRNAEILEKIKGYNPRSQLSKAVNLAEVSAVRLRYLAARADSRDKGKLYASVAEAQQMEIRDYPDWIRITVPGILPGRNRGYVSEFLIAPLRRALLEHLTAHPRERYHNCAICIVHQYDEALGPLQYREDDGVEMKRFLDVIEVMLLTNDSSLYCSVLHCVESGPEDIVKIYLMKPEALPKWLEERGKDRKEQRHGQKD